MTIEQLRHDVNSRLPIPVTLAFADLPPETLGTLRPNNHGSFDISISAEFAQSENAMNIEAHEFAHIKLFLDGLIALGLHMLDTEAQEMLKRAINDAISHPFVVRIVEEYGLTNQPYYELCDSLVEDHYDEYIQPPTAVFVPRVVGVFLYGIWNANPNLRASVEEILHQNSLTGVAFRIVQSHLDGIDLRMELQEQADRITSMLREMGCEFDEEPEVVGSTLRLLIRE